MSKWHEKLAKPESWASTNMNIEISYWGQVSMNSSKKCKTNDVISLLNLNILFVVPFGRVFDGTILVDWLVCHPACKERLRLLNPNRFLELLDFKLFMKQIKTQGRADRFCY